MTSTSSATNTASKRISWVDIPHDSDFSLDNIPFGICSFPDNGEKNGNNRNICYSSLAPSVPRCCTAIGNYAVDLHLLAEAGLLDDLKLKEGGVLQGFHSRIVFSQSSLNEFMACEKRVWVAVRNRLISLFMNNYKGEGDSNQGQGSGSDLQLQLKPDTRLRHNQSLQKAAMHPLSAARYHLPAKIGDYTDFYSSREHATNVGIMFRGKDNALQPNWLHMPIGYHGRSSSVYPSVSTGIDTIDIDSGGGGDKQQQQPMSTVRRPCGQLQLDPSDPKKGSTYGPCKLMDFELEVAFFVGGSTNRDDDDDTHNKQNDDNSNSGKPLTFAQAKDRIFGYVLMNDWSARDIQKWEYVPLGPFTAKNFGTTISTWVVTPMALEPFRCETSAGTQGGLKNCSGGGGGGTELSDGVDVGGDDGIGERKVDPTPLEYLRDPDYGSYNVNLTVSLQPETTLKTTQICQSNLKDMYWSSTQQLVHHSVTGCPMNAGDLLASGTISGKERRNFGSMLELSWKGTRDIELDNGKEVRKFLKDGDAVIMEGWCEKDGTGRVGFGQCAGRVLPAIPFPYHSRQQEEAVVVHPSPTKQQQRYTNFKLYGFWRSSCAWRVRIALAAKGIHYETVPINLFEKGQSSEEHMTKNPMQQVPVLEFLDGGCAVRITQSLAIIEFLESAFADQGGRLLPLDPVARAKAKEVAEVINSGTQPLQNLSVMDSIEIIGGDNDNNKGLGIKFGKRANENGLSSLESLLAPIHTLSSCAGEEDGVVAGPFAIGAHGPSLADICLIPQLYNARRFGVDCSAYPTLLRIEEACKDHPWFCNAVPGLQPDFPNDE